MSPQTHVKDLIKVTALFSDLSFRSICLSTVNNMSVILNLMTRALIM